MPKGPRRGPPLSPNILTERTGEFRRSVRVIPNYRKSLIRFFYNPLYGVHREQTEIQMSLSPKRLEKLCLDCIRGNLEL